MITIAVSGDAFLGARVKLDAATIGIFPLLKLDAATFDVFPLLKLDAATFGVFPLLKLGAVAFYVFSRYLFDVRRLSLLLVMVFLCN